MASLDEVERSLQELIERLRATEEAQTSLRASIREDRILSLHVSDLDAAFWTELAEGSMRELRAGEPPGETHVRVRATSDDVVALARGDLTLVAAYLSGRVRIDAGVADMLQLRRLL